ncbi:MAG TPA: IPT/TIG domain-containing protein [Bryocella sp.]|nr:IPT/TIG domain-containing protein [Bryocella sp.]
MASPVITSIAPISGPGTGGTIVTLTGTGFTGALAVGFGPTNASALSVISDTTMVAVSPAGTGTVNVTVVTPGGISAVSGAVQFGYAGGTSSDGSTSYYVDPALTSQIVGSLVNLIQANNSPDAIAAQSILMRRLALEGDVVGSRIPPPRNISEVGGYLNLLGTLGETAMREQALAGILGVAGPTPALGFQSAQPLSMVSLTNDRPAGTAQPTLPLSVLVRSDFLNPFLAAMQTLHAQGATLPCSGPSALALPPGGPGSVLPTDLLLYLGRVLTLATTAALIAPGTDPLVLARPAGSAVAFGIAANVLSPGTVAVAPANYDALQINAGAIAPASLVGAALVMVAPLLAGAGFYPASPFPTPTTPADSAWARMTNITGLVPGTTSYGDELALLYPPSVIAASALAPALGYVWDGTTFAP